MSSASVAAHSLVPSLLSVSPPSSPSAGLELSPRSSPSPPLPLLLCPFFPLLSFFLIFFLPFAVDLTAVINDLSTEANTQKTRRPSPPDPPLAFF